MKRELWAWIIKHWKWKETLWFVSSKKLEKAAEECEVKCWQRLIFWRNREPLAVQQNTQRSTKGVSALAASFPGSLAEDTTSWSRRCEGEGQTPRAFFRLVSQPTNPFRESLSRENTQPVPLWPPPKAKHFKISRCAETVLKKLSKELPWPWTLHIISLRTLGKVQKAGTKDNVVPVF